MLASTSRQSLWLPSGHANRSRNFLVSGRRCWRRSAGKALAFRLVTPTSSGFPRASGVPVGVDLPAKPLPSVWSRQQAQDFPGLPVFLLALTSRQSHCLPSGHANKFRISPGFRCPCWRRSPGKAFSFRPVTPTSSGFPRASGVHVGVDLPAKPLASVWSRQQAQDFPGLSASMLASTSRQSPWLPSGHANKLRISPGFRRPCWRRPPGKALSFCLVTPTRTEFFGLAGADVGVDLPAKPLPSVWSRQQERALPV